MQPEVFVLLVTFLIILIVPFISSGIIGLVNRHIPEAKRPSPHRLEFFEFVISITLTVAIFPRLLLSLLSYRTAGFIELVTVEQTNELRLFLTYATQNSSYTLGTWIALITVGVLYSFSMRDEEVITDRKLRIKKKFIFIAGGIVLLGICTLGGLHNNKPAVQYGDVLVSSNLYKLPIAPDMALMERLEGHCGDTSVVAISKHKVQCRDELAWQAPEIHIHDIEISLFPYNQILIWFKDGNEQHQALLAIDKSDNPPQDNLESYADSINERANGVLGYALKMLDSDLNARTGEHLAGWNEVAFDNK